jgi:hypothetical protein
MVDSAKGSMGFSPGSARHAATDQPSVMFKELIDVGFTRYLNVQAGLPDNNAIKRS